MLRKLFIELRSEVNELKKEINKLKKNYKTSDDDDDTLIDKILPQDLKPIEHPQSISEFIQKRYDEGEISQRLYNRIMDDSKHLLNLKHPYFVLNHLTQKEFLSIRNAGDKTWQELQYLLHQYQY